MNVKNVLVNGEGWFNVSSERLSRFMLLYVRVVLGVFVVLTALVALSSVFIGICSAVPVYDAVELCASPTLPYIDPYGIAATSTGDVWIGYWAGANTKFTLHPGCNAKSDEFVKSANIFKGMEWYNGKIYYNMADEGGTLYRCDTDGSNSIQIRSFLYNRRFKDISYNTGGECFGITTDGEYCELPNVDGEILTLVYAHGSSHWNGFSTRSDGSYMTTQYQTTRVNFYNASHGLVCQYNIAGASTTNAAGIDFDADEETLWIVSGSGAKFYRYSLPNLPALESGGGYNVSLSGKTRDITGNIVSSVLVEIDEYNDTSNSLGDYLISGALIGDSLTVEASKSGYENYTVTLHGITEDGSYLHDIYMIPEGELANGDIGGVVYDYCDGVIIGNALVNLYDRDSDNLNYTYTSEYGYYKFSDLENATNYSLFASKAEYENSEKYSFLAYNTTYYVKNIWLLPLGGCEEGLPAEATPTPTPGPGDDTPIVTGIELLFELFGLSGYMYYILALLCILVAGGTFGYITSGNTMAIAIGSFFGFVIDVALGWLPVWLVAVVICVTIFLIVRQIRTE